MLSQPPARSAMRLLACSSPDLRWLRRSRLRSGRRRDQKAVIVQMARASSAREQSQFEKVQRLISKALEEGAKLMRVVLGDRRVRRRATT